MKKVDSGKKYKEIFYKLLIKNSFQQEVKDIRKKTLPPRPWS